MTRIPTDEEVEAAARGMWESEPIVFGWNDSERKLLGQWDDAVARNLYGVQVYRDFARAALTAAYAVSPGEVRLDPQELWAWGEVDRLSGVVQKQYEQLEGFKNPKAFLNYQGAMADLASAVDVLIRRINGEAPIASAAPWVQLNYPKQAAKIKYQGPHNITVGERNEANAEIWRRQTITAEADILALKTIIRANSLRWGGTHAEVDEMFAGLPSAAKPKTGEDVSGGD